MVLTDEQIACLEDRRISLGFSRTGAFKRFYAALRADIGDCSPLAARMRFDRIFIPHLRCPVSEVSRFALAKMLGWTVPELDAALRRAARDASPGQQAV